jgi:protocatechuate 3,4-dioxygenase beta subunit
MRMTLAFVVCAAELLLRAAAQAPVSSQETVSTKESPTASLEGRVVKDPGGEPLKKAIVELIGENQEEAGNYTATSDQEGHFKITGIRAGRYHLFVERTGYLEVDEKHRHSAGLALSFDAGQDVKDQLLRMLPAAIITGRVVDEDGDPMPDVMITVLRRKWPGNRMKFEASGSAQTNDLGEFRVGGLFPGKYYVSAMPLPNFQSLLPLPKNTDDRTAPQPDLSYVTTFYPNGVDRAQASPIEVHAGDDMPVDFSLTRVHTARIRGAVEGLAPGARGAVILRAKDSNSMLNAAEIGKDGKFEISHLAPGTYTVMAVIVIGETPQIMQRSVEVGEANIDDLRLSPQPLATIRGQVRFPKSFRPDSSPTIISLHHIDEEGDFFDNVPFPTDDSSGTHGATRIKADGSFELNNVPSGIYAIRISSDAKALGDSFVESVVAGTKDVVDTGLSVSGGTLNVNVTVSTEYGVLDGTASNDRGQPVANAVMIALPAPQFRKQPDRYTHVTTDQRGRFTMRGLRPGEYKLLGWEVLEGDEYLDPEFLAPFEAQATAVKVDKGAHQTVSVKVVPASPDQP